MLLHEAGLYIELITIFLRHKIDQPRPFKAGQRLSAGLHGCGSLERL